MWKTLVIVVIFALCFTSVSVSQSQPSQPSGPDNGYLGFFHPGPNSQDFFSPLNLEQGTEEYRAFVNEMIEAQQTSTIPRSITVTNALSGEMIIQSILARIEPQRHGIIVTEIRFVPLELTFHKGNSCGESYLQQRIILMPTSPHCFWNMAANIAHELGHFHPNCILLKIRDEVEACAENFRRHVGF